MSDSPRTDAEADLAHNWAIEHGGLLFVPVDFARQLERENAALRQQLVERDALKMELSHMRARVEHSVQILSSIHNLLYPPPVSTEDGRTMVFRPKNIDPHEVIQELSDRIRALPDEMAKAGLSPYLTSYTAFAEHDSEVRRQALEEAEQYFQSMRRSIIMEPEAVAGHIRRMAKEG